MVDELLKHIIKEIFTTIVTNLIPSKGRQKNDIVGSY
jgi:hypothetical protein